MQSLLLALMLLLQQQQPLLGGRQLVGLTDDGRSAAALSDNLNSTLVPGKTIKAIERQMKAADEVAAGPAEKLLQVTPANQLPVDTPPTTSARPSLLLNSNELQSQSESFMAATMVTGNHSVQGELKRMESAETLDAITAAATAVPEAAAGVSAAAASAVITAAIEATAATSPTREQHMLLPRPTAVQMARINVPATIEDQIGRAVIPSKTNKAETPATSATTAATPTPTAAIMPAKTKRNGEDGTNKRVQRDGMKFNTDAALSQDYVNATEAWPATTTTANIVATASTISPALTSTAERISGKTVPTPRLLGSGSGAMGYGAGRCGPDPGQVPGQPATDLVLRLAG
nr:mucin-5AC-like [Drosophila takahashii]